VKDNVLPFYDERGLKVVNIMADSGIDLTDHWGSKYCRFLHEQQVRCLETKSHRSQDHGFIERFWTTVRDELFHELFLQALPEVPHQDELRRKLDKWLPFYNTDRPHLGYPNMGSSPIQRIAQYLNGLD
jgi:transposase InsO family protein